MTKKQLIQRLQNSPFTRFLRRFWQPDRSWKKAGYIMTFLVFAGFFAFFGITQHEAGFHYMSWLSGFCFVLCVAALAAVLAVDEV